MVHNVPFTLYKTPCKHESHFREIKGLALTEWKLPSIQYYIKD